MDMRAKTCCFTGHRSLNGAEKLTVGVRLRKTIKELVKQGVVFYGAGGALGFDTLAAQTVLDMKKEYPQLRLILVLPCEDQTRGWRSEDIAVYENIKRRSDKVAYVSKEYKAHIVPSEYLHRVADLEIIAPPAGKVFHNADTDFPVFHIVHHAGVGGTVKKPAAFVIVDVVPDIG